MRLDLGAAPHLVGGETFGQITRTTLAAACLPALAGVALFGLPAAQWLVVCVVTAVIAEWVCVKLSLHRITATYDHAALMGLLVGLTLPVGRFDAAGFHPLGWAVPMCAALASIVVGKAFLGGMGNYLWHPALVGRAAAELLYGDQMHPKKWVVLGRHDLFSSVVRPVQPNSYVGWSDSVVPDGFNAWALRRPLGWIRDLAEGKLKTGGENPITVLVRDHLPPWQDTLLGGLGGGIGETCAVALLVGGLYLIYRGYVRWSQPASVIAAAAVAAAVLPVRTGPAGGFAWLPGLDMDGAMPVGLLYVMYHVTSGGLLLGAFFFATDMVASPRTARGQLIFGVGIGALTIALRLYGPTPGSCYWAILIMGTLIGMIDRRTKRRVMGT